MHESLFTIYAYYCPKQCSFLDRPSCPTPSSRTSATIEPFSPLSLVAFLGIATVRPYCVSFRGCFGGHCGWLPWSIKRVPELGSSHSSPHPPHHTPVLTMAVVGRKARASTLISPVWLCPFRGECNFTRTLPTPSREAAFLALLFWSPVFWLVGQAAMQCRRRINQKVAALFLPTVSSSWTLHATFHARFPCHRQTSRQRFVVDASLHPTGSHRSLPRSFGVLTTTETVLRKPKHHSQETKKVGSLIGGQKRGKTI